MGVLLLFRVKEVSIVVKRVRLNRKTRPRKQVHFQPEQDLPTWKRWKKFEPKRILRIPVRGWCAYQLFSSPHGWLISPLDARNLLPETQA